MSRVVLFWVALLFFVGGVSLVWIGVKNADRMTARGGSEPVVPATKAVKTNRAVGDTAKPKEWLTKYELTDRSERKIGTEQLAGKIHLASFFFATCPASCRTQNQVFADLEREFGKQGVKFVAISCDPDTDTPEKLREYAQIFNAPKDSWYFLTGDLPYTRRVAAEIYGVPLDRKTHVEKFVLVDGTGKVRGYYAWDDASKLQDLRTDLRKMLDDKHAVTAGERKESQARQARIAAEEDEDSEMPAVDEASNANDLNNTTTIDSQESRPTEDAKAASDQRAEGDA